MSLLSFYKNLQPRGYNRGTYLIEDTTSNSLDYFNVQHFPDTMGGGKNMIILKGNGTNLRVGGGIDVEVIDAQGKNIYAEVTNYIDRFNNYYITVEIYDITAKGDATIYLVGEALYDIPAFEKQIRELEDVLQILVDEQRALQDQYNTANNNLSNSTKALNTLREAIDADSIAIATVRGWLQAAINLINGIPDYLIPQKAKDEIADFKAQIQSFSNRLTDNNFRLPNFVDKAIEEQRIVDRLLAQVQDATNEVRRQQQVINELEPQPLPQPPDSQRPSYNVRWQRQVKVLPFDRNNSEVVFDAPPKVNITQVITPERTLLSQTGSNQWTVVTSSVNDLTITTSKFQGYDREFASSPDILDPRLKSILINPKKKPATTNTINSSLRVKSTDVENGYIKELSSRFNTVVTSANRSIKKDYLGGTFEFFSSGSTPKNLSPNIPTGYVISGSVASQLQSYYADVVEVISDTQMRVSNPVQVKILQSGSIQRGYTTDFKYQQASKFTASIVYSPSDGAFVTSSNVSQSYLEVTFSDLKPIGGEVYRIKTYYKRGIASGEFKAIYDHVVRPVEYLTEATFPNQTSYARHESDYRLIGHFTDPIYTTYWDTYVETPAGIYYTTTPSIRSASLHESIPINADYTESGIFATKFNQNYTNNQIYTLSFLVALDPYTELEVYMNSDPISSNTIIPTASPRAFARSNNKENTRYAGSVNRFGKYIGKIQNPKPNAKYYGRVEFDFLTDADGLGRPLFRSNTTSVESTAGDKVRRNVTGSAYVAEVSIKPLTMNGFSPNLVQFAIPFNNEIDNILALSQSLDFKIEYFDFTGRQSEYITTIDDLVVNLKGEIPTNSCQAETIDFYINFTSDQTT